MSEPVARCGRNCVAYVVRNGDISFPILTPKDRLEVTLDQMDVLLIVLADSLSTRGDAAILLNKSYHLLRDFELRGYDVAKHSTLFGEALRSFLLNDFVRAKSLAVQLEQNLSSSVDKLVKELRDENRRLKEELEALRRRLMECEELKSALEKMLERVTSEYDSLRSKYDSLKIDYAVLEVAHSVLKESCDGLMSDLKKTASDYNVLLSEFRRLSSAYEDLEPRYRAQIGMTCAVLVTTIAFVASTVYLATRIRRGSEHVQKG